MVMIVITAASVSRAFPHSRTPYTRCFSHSNVSCILVLWSAIFTQLSIVKRWDSSALTIVCHKTFLGTPWAMMHQRCLFQWRHACFVCQVTDGILIDLTQLFCKRIEVLAMCVSFRELVTEWWDFKHCFSSLKLSKHLLMDRSLFLDHGVGDGKLSLCQLAELMIFSV